MMLFSGGVTHIIIEQPTGCVYPRPGQSARAMTRIAKNVGVNMARAEALINGLRDRLKDTEIQVIARAPMNKLTKLSQKQIEVYFPEMKGKRTSSHARDALMISRFGI